MSLEKHEKDILERFKDGFKRKDHKVFMKQVCAQIKEGIARDKHVSQERLLELFNEAQAWREEIESKKAQRKANELAKQQEEEDGE